MSRDNLALKKLKGIKEEKQVDAVEQKGENALNELNKWRDWFIKYCYKIARVIDRPLGQRHDYVKLVKKLRNVEFNEQDLKAYIHANSNFEFQVHDPYVNEYGHGIYTGFLLSLLTHRNEELGKGTEFVINGYGNRFPYLFTHARKVDKLVVDNFRGESICSSFPDTYGKANQVIVMNCEGKDMMAHAGQGGKIGFLGLINCKSNRAFERAGEFGETDSVAILNSNVRGMHLMLADTSPGIIKSVVVINSDPGDYGSAIGAGSGKEGTIEVYAYLNNIEDKRYLIPSLEKGVKKVLVYNNWASKDHLRNVKTPDVVRIQPSSPEYEKYRIEELIQLANGMKGKDYKSCAPLIDQFIEAQYALRGDTYE